MIVAQLKQSSKKVNEKHSNLVDKYFKARKRLKDVFASVKKENESLKTANSTLETKITSEMKVYEKDNKAKQTLIIRKSEDFE